MSTGKLKQNKKTLKEEAYMKRGSVIILRGAVILLGLTVLALCLFVLPSWISSDKTGYYRPVLIGMYVTAIPFFFALHQTLKLLGYIDKNKAFTELSVRALKNIKYCGLVISGLFAAGQPYVFYAADRDDAPGVALVGFVIIGTSFVIATAAGVFQSLVQNAVDIKAENDLTV